MARPVPEAVVKLRVGKVPYPEAVIFVVETLVEETVVAMIVPTEKLPADVIVPVAETRNWVDELTWKLMKSPEKATGLMPIYVPDAALPPWMMLGPRRRSELVAWAKGFAEKMVDEEKVAIPVTLRVEPIVA